MKILLLSDLHNEFECYQPPPVDADIVVLAGDIDLGIRGVEWATSVFTCPVLYVAGNHEFYRGHLKRTLEKIRAAQTDRVRVLDRDVVELGGVRFLGATAWTDFAATDNQPTAAALAGQLLNDFRQIRTENYRPCRPLDFITQASLTRLWLQEQLAILFSGPTVVITHHAPSLRSLQDNPHAGGHLDAAFANQWDDLMGDPISLWLHGHVHTAVDYELRGTRVVCNPRGYPGEQTGWSPYKLIQLTVPEVS
ncbi:metallophosphoesterase [Pseudomonas nitroreducens]|uniref:metallophosphoesterase n=1 Tax=Pseudomonas nitroreducens TaxID=46680 RepID=UPI00209E8F32|nr:metallophosphoesterase [Pseudomonas nitroreducens]MCP1621519.1 putative phosphodiesterase [Pseudomonas nitroreducens]